MDTVPSEREILLRLVAGDEAMFVLLYETYHHAIYLNVVKLLHTPVEAEDIVQEVFLTLWKKRTSIDPDKPVGGWLFTVSYRLSVDLLKKKFRLGRLAPMAPAIDISQQDTESPDFQLDLLEEAITHLSPQKRKVFQLCKLEGKSYEQASAELGISKYTINEYLKDGMSFIRQYVKAKVSLPSLFILLIAGAILGSILSFC